MKYINIFSKLNLNNKHLLIEKDFIFLLSLLIVDETDNVDYFLYKFNISKKDQKRIKIIDNFYKEKITKKSFTEKKINKVFYYYGKQAVDDILIFGIFKYQKYSKNLIELNQIFKTKTLQTMPIGADLLMNKYQIPEGKQLGFKLKMIEEEWIENNFKISDQQVENILKN